MKNHPKRWKWRLEWLAQTGMEICVGLLPGPLVFRLGEAIGGLAWHFMAERRHVVLRNLRIALHGEFDLPTLEKMTLESFRRTGANLLSAAHTARLPMHKIDGILSVENPELIEAAVAGGKGLVLMPPHMGNWEVLTRINRFFPPGHASGAFYRPLNNPILDEQLLAQREADGTRLFSKRDSFHLVTGFIRDGGIVGILADQRVGIQGELVRFFGRMTRASPLPSLMARRSRSQIFSMSLITDGPGKWKVRYHAVEGAISTTSCMKALEQAMRANPLDVFWLQERWKVYFGKGRTIREWLGEGTHGEGTPHRALLWLAGVPDSWQIPEEWVHPDVIYEAVVAPGQKPPAWFSGSEKLHIAPAGTSRDILQKALFAMDRDALLPLDYVLTANAPKALAKACARESIPLVSLPSKP
ncbi:MAG: hypothetical protein V4584_08195 [Verrucomicrobiota bacterium]